MSDDNVCPMCGEVADIGHADDCPADPIEQYEIGGMCCTMRRSQAHEWNVGNVSADSMAGAVVHIPGRAGARSSIRRGEVCVDDGLPTVQPKDLWSAIENVDGTDSDLYTECMDGMPANRIA